MASITTYITIFLIKLLGGGLANYRLIMMKEGNRLIVSFLTILTSLSWILSMGLVMVNFNDDIFITLPFLLGVVGGNYVGMFVNDKIKTGHILTTIIIDEDKINFAKNLKELNFDVKVFDAKGKDSNKKVLIIKTKSSDHKNLVNIIKDLDISSFLINERIEEVY